MKVIVAMAYADDRPCPFAGQYLKGFDFDAAGGRGKGDFTADPLQAKTFLDAGEAMAFWRTPSTAVPIRDDGKPNRPFTSITVEITDAPEDGHA